MLETTGPSVTALMRAPSTASRGRINVLITCRRQNQDVGADQKERNDQKTEEEQNHAHIRPQFCESSNAAITCRPLGFVVQPTLRKQGRPVQYVDVF